MKPFKGKNFYRLAEVDIDGTITYSNIIVFNFNSATPEIDIYPNPAHQFITIGFINMPINNNAINIFDITGKRVISNTNVSGNTIKLDLQKLNSGTYFVKVVGADGTTVQSKFLLLRD